MGNSIKLTQLLEKGAKYHPNYRNGLSSHLPMVLVALDRLGASEQKLEQFYCDYIDVLDLADGASTVERINDVSEYLGDSEKYLSYLKYFQSRLELEGYESVLKTTLLQLIPGISAAAFHTLIRLAYAVEAENDTEIAIALAYWSAEYQAFDLDLSETNCTLEEILFKLAPLGVQHSFMPGIIVDRMNEIGELLRHSSIKIIPKDLTLESLKLCCLDAFYSKDDFTLLHTVTGCHAFSIILPFINDIDFALKQLWQAVLVAYLSTGLPYSGFSGFKAVQHVDFESVINKAISSNDDHIIKLTFTCYQEYLSTDNAGYFSIAQRAVRNDS
ncbi:hypothetical protein SOPP22_15065 [Shewanella sp. OPT22]|nr:hypothetical protein SOPP22_15065 [Shewanella sp. OPT22]